MKIKFMAYDMFCSRIISEGINDSEINTSYPGNGEKEYVIIDQCFEKTFFKYSKDYLSKETIGERLIIVAGIPAIYHIDNAYFVENSAPDLNKCLGSALSYLNSYCKGKNRVTYVVGAETEEAIQAMQELVQESEIIEGPPNNFVVESNNLCERVASHKTLKTRVEQALRNLAII